MTPDARLLLILIIFAGASAGFYWAVFGAWASIDDDREHEAE